MPKISSPSRVSRTVLSEPQTARTIVSLIEVIQQPVAQTVDIPVPPSYGLRGSSTAVTEQRIVQQIVDIPPRGGLLPPRSEIRSDFFTTCWRRMSREFSHFFPSGKSAKATRQVGAGVVADSSSSTPFAHAMSTLASHHDGLWEDQEGD